MFSILTTLLAIVLVIALVVITTYFMGDDLFSSRKEAEATAVINTATQIKAAAKMYQAQHIGAMPESLEELANTGYLKAVPEGGWEFGNGTLQKPEIDEEICKAVNMQLFNDPAIPACSTVDAGYLGCCAK